MRITDGEKRPLRSVYLALTDDEANELRDALEQLVQEGDGWHAHVSDTEFKVEVMVYRADDPTSKF